MAYLRLWISFRQYSRSSYSYTLLAFSISTLKITSFRLAILLFLAYNSQQISSCRLLSFATSVGPSLSAELSFTLVSVVLRDSTFCSAALSALDSSLMVSLSFSFSKSCMLAILTRLSQLTVGNWMSSFSVSCLRFLYSSSSVSLLFSSLSWSIWSLSSSHSLGVSCLCWFICFSRSSQSEICMRQDWFCSLTDSREDSQQFILVLSLQFSSTNLFTFSSKLLDSSSILRLAICSSYFLLSASWISFQIATCLVRWNTWSLSSSSSSFSVRLVGTQGVLGGMLRSSLLSLSISLLNMSSLFWYSCSSLCRYSSLRFPSASTSDKCLFSSSTYLSRLLRLSLSIWFSLPRSMLMPPKFWLWNMSSLILSVQKFLSLQNYCSAWHFSCSWCSYRCISQDCLFSLASCCITKSTLKPSQLLSSVILAMRAFFSPNSFCASFLVKSLSSFVSLSYACMEVMVSFRQPISLSFSSSLELSAVFYTPRELCTLFLWRSMVSKGEVFLHSLTMLSLRFTVLEQVFLKSELDVQGRFLSRLSILKQWSLSSLLFLTISIFSFSGQRSNITFFTSFLYALWHLGLPSDLLQSSSLLPGPSFFISFSKSFFMLESSAFMFWKKALLLLFSTFWRGEFFQSILQGTKSCSWLREPLLEERVMAWGWLFQGRIFFIDLILKFIIVNQDLIIWALTFICGEVDFDREATRDGRR